MKLHSSTLLEMYLLLDLLLLRRVIYSSTACLLWPNAKGRIVLHCDSYKSYFAREFCDKFTTSSSFSFAFSHSVHLSWQKKKQASRERQKEREGHGGIEQFYLLRTNLHWQFNVAIFAMVDDNPFSFSYTILCHWAPLLSPKSHAHCFPLFMKSDVLDSFFFHIACHR